MGREGDKSQAEVLGLNIFSPAIPPQMHEKAVRVQSVPWKSHQDGESCEVLVTERWGAPG